MIKGEDNNMLERPVVKIAPDTYLVSEYKLVNMFLVVGKHRAALIDTGGGIGPVPFPVSWTVKMKKKQKETQDILSYHTQAAGCSDKARAKASGGRQPIEECGRTGL